MLPHPTVGGSDRTTATTYINQILFGFKLVDDNLFHVLESRQTNVQPARDPLVSVGREEFIEHSGQNVDHLVAPVEHAQRPAPNVLGEDDDFPQDVAQRQVAQIIGGDQAAGRGAGHAIHPIARNILVPTIDHAEVVDACVRVWRLVYCARAARRLASNG